MMMDKIKNKSNCLWFGIPIVALLVGLIVIAFLIIDYVKDSRDDTFKIIVPGAKTFVLTKTGTYTVFHEYRSRINGKRYYTESDLAGLRCALVDKSTGKEVFLPAPSGYLYYNNFFGEGKSVLEFKIKKPGMYQFLGWYEKGIAGEKVVMKIIHNDWDLAVLIFKMMGVFLGAAAVQVLMFLLANRPRRADSGVKV